MFSLSLSSGSRYRFQLDESGTPSGSLQFQVHFREPPRTGNEPRAIDVHKDYTLEIVLARGRFLFTPQREWKSQPVLDPYSNRKDWYFIRIDVSIKEITSVSEPIDHRWFRDLARSMDANVPSVPFSAFLQWPKVPAQEAFEAIETTPERPLVFEIENDLKGLHLTTIDPCYKHSTGAQHKQEIRIDALGTGYAILQWYRGVFVRWNQASGKYAYIYGLPSAGEEISGYMPEFKLDTSRKFGPTDAGHGSSSAIPNFFNVQAKSGTDTPGDQEGAKKDWGEYDHELLLAHFVTRVYLAVDVDRPVAFDKKTEKDLNGIEYETLTNYRFTPFSDDSMQGATLQPLAEGDWNVGILWAKQGAEISHVDRSNFDPGKFPEPIRKILQEVFKNGNLRPPDLRF